MSASGRSRRSTTPDTGSSRPRPSRRRRLPAAPRPRRRIRPRSRQRIASRPRASRRARMPRRARRSDPELMHVRDGDDDRAGVPQPPVKPRLAGSDSVRVLDGAVPGARQGSANMSLTATGTPCRGPSGASASILAASLPKLSAIERTGRRARRFARASPRAARSRRARRPRSRAPARAGQVLRMVAHALSPAAVAPGGPDGSRPCSGGTALRSAASIASRGGP